MPTLFDEPFGRRLVGAAALALAPWLSSHAACTVTAAPAALNFGARTVQALPQAEITGWKVLGQQSGTLTGVCDAARSQLRLRFANVQASSTPGLLRLPEQPAAGAGAAVRLQVLDARAGAVPAMLSLEGSAAAPAPSVEAAEGGAVVVVHLAAPLPAHTPFTLRVSMTGLVPQGFRPSRLTTFSFSPAVELLP